MVRITEDLVRKHAEHNEGLISSLEELSLHQTDIERIEYIDKWCCGLKILYLQGNLIPKIENVSRLKQLEYLNLALNNISKIENLCGCELLNKLDLTANFIGTLTSVKNLQFNSQLRTLFLTGNPCTGFDGYRSYVIATLPQLEQLDGVDIQKSSRIEAIQEYGVVSANILQQERAYLKKEEEEQSSSSDTSKQPLDNDEFWKEPTKYTPQSRIETHNYLAQQRSKKDGVNLCETTAPERQVRYFDSDDQPLNVNQGRLHFVLQDDEDEGAYKLEVACYRHLDTDLISLDVQPTYVRISVKGKVLQLVLMSEVSPDASSAQRSQATGHLHVVMPKCSSLIVKPRLKKPVVSKVDTPISSVANCCDGNKPALSLDLLLSQNHVEDIPCARQCVQSVVPNDFVDNPDVPPLI